MRCRAGICLRQGPHQVAQKSKTTTRSVCAAGPRTSPANVLRLNGGAVCASIGRTFASPLKKLAIPLPDEATRLQREWAAQEDQAALAWLRGAPVQVVPAEDVDIGAMRHRCAVMVAARLQHLPASLAAAYASA